MNSALLSLFARSLNLPLPSPLLWTYHRPDRLPPPEEEPTGEEHNKEIERTECNDDAKVLPLLAVENIEASCKLITIGVLTELTDTIRSSLHIPASLCDKRLGVSLTGLTRWSRKAGKLVGFTPDGAFVNCSAEVAFQEVAKWRKIIHPRSPEIW